MKTTIKHIYGNWDIGYALDKHTLHSVPIGTNAYGHTVFDTTRTEVGEALYQLKYRHDWSQVATLAAELEVTLYPKFQNVGMIIPMPASTTRDRQPVTEVAKELGNIVNKPCFDNLLIKIPNGKPLKDINSKAEKIEALQGTLQVKEIISNEGKWNVMLVDDLYHTGASLELACDTLRGYTKIGKIYVAVLTWR